MEYPQVAGRDRALEKRNSESPRFSIIIVVTTKNSKKNASSRERRDAML